MTDTTDAIYDVLVAYTGLSDARNHDIAVRVADAISAHIEAREAAAAAAEREACALIADAAAKKLATAINSEWGYAGSFATRIRYHGRKHEAEGIAAAIRALPLPAADALARALERARVEEREVCAREADCGCAARADVLARLATDGEKRASYLCVHGDVCCALQAAAIRARGQEKA